MTAFKSTDAYEDFARLVQTERRWIFDGPAKDFLDTVRATSAARVQTLKAGKQFYRAQSGSRTQCRLDVDGADIGVDEEVPLPKEYMVPEPKYMKTGGRANPSGFAYLYLATAPETALAEMRPWLHEHLTVALFELTRETKLVVCRREKEDIFERLLGKDPSSEQVNQYVWNDIGRAFARPVSKEDQHSAYIPTQILAEVFKAEGFDGLAYRSGLDRGTNVVLFDVKAAKPVRSYLYWLKKVRYDFEAAHDFAIYRTTNGKGEHVLELHSETPDP
jgi:RES domain-containing protein